MSRDYYRQVNVSNTVINTTIINNTYVSNFTTTTAAPHCAHELPQPAGTQCRHRGAAGRVRAGTAGRPGGGEHARRHVERAQIQSLARVAPSRKAFTGDAPAARGMPPAAVQQRTVIAKSAPPPAATPVAQRVTALERDPGKPVDRSAVQPGVTRRDPARPQPVPVRAPQPRRPLPSTTSRS